MKIHSFESFGAVDGPGIRSIAFLSGCPFRCAYCHNPDTWALPAAIEMQPDEVLKKLLKYRAYWGKDGGITASGGEPMLQAEETAQLFSLAHEAGVSTCLDTAAGCFDRNDSSIVQLLNESDTVILDMKAFSSDLHMQLTSSGNSQVLECAEFLNEIGKPTWIRRVIVPGFTDSEDDLKKTGEFIRRLSNIKQVEALPYHTLGISKWKNLGLDYKLHDAVPPTEDMMLRAKKLLGA